MNPFLFLSLGMGLFLPVTAQLSFPQTEIRCKIPPEEKEHTLHIPFTVVGATSLKDVHERCSCTTATFSDGKTVWNTGEKGHLEVSLDTLILKGNSSKTIELTFQEHEPITITLHTEIPIAISPSPRVQRWKVGEVTEKEYQITIAPAFDFSIVGVNVSNPDFRYTLTLLKTPTEGLKGRVYSLKVKPLKTQDEGVCMIRCLTDSKIDRYRTLSVMAILED